MIMMNYSVDDKTESIMLDVIAGAFKHHTVISVVHRLVRMEEYDRVMVIKGGRIVEFDTPRALLGRESVFRGLVRAYEKRS